MKWWPRQVRWTIFDALELYDQRRVRQHEWTWWQAFWKGVWAAFWGALIPGIVAVVWMLIFN